MKSFDLRNKLISKVKTVQEQELERQKNRVQKCKAGSILGSALDHSKQRSPSVNSISSDDSILSDKNPSKKKKRKKDSDSSDERETAVKGKQQGDIHSKEFRQFYGFSPLFMFQRNILVRCYRVREAIRYSTQTLANG